jgi:predicted glycosyltransferase
MKKIFFYSQHLLGIGHFTRSLKLCEQLASTYQVNLFNGGTPVPYLVITNLKVINLPPLSTKEDFKILYSPEGRELSEVWDRRTKILNQDSEIPDVIIVELFPFGRSLFEKEILEFIEYYKKINPQLIIICSLRDILVDSLSEHVRGIVDKFFDYVLLHTDSSVITGPLPVTPEGFLKGTKTLVHETGYISVDRTIPIKKKQIIVSIGGGAIGEELLVAMNEVNLAHHVILVGGPQISRKAEEALCSKLGSNVRYMSFCPDLPSLLAESSLSISTGGYNTLLESIAVNTFPVIYPLKHNREQLTRAEAFNRLELCEILHDIRDIQSLFPRCLNRTLPDPLPLKMDGAKATLAFINEVL